jgi:hypothetical protein
MNIEFLKPNRTKTILFVVLAIFALDCISITQPALISFNPGVVIACPYPSILLQVSLFAQLIIVVFAFLLSIPGAMVVYAADWRLDGIAITIIFILELIYLYLLSCVSFGALAKIPDKTKRNAVIAILILTILAAFPLALCSYGFANP